MGVAGTAGSTGGLLRRAGAGMGARMDPWTYMKNCHYAFERGWLGGLGRVRPPKLLILKELPILFVLSYLRRARIFLILKTLEPRCSAIQLLGL